MQSALIISNCWTIQTYAYASLIRSTCLNLHSTYKLQDADKYVLYELLCYCSYVDAALKLNLIFYIQTF